MRVLIIGGGGREHALAWRLAQSPEVERVFAAPGNPGIARVAACLPAGDGSPDAYVAIADSVEADLTVVGPEAPLVAGVVDAFRARGRAIFGPTAAAARLEGSKIFAKNFLQQSGIPTAAFVVAPNAAEARRALDRFTYPVVIKADGLAAGKGVVIAADAAEARATLEALLVEHRFATETVLVEEHLEGPELSLLALCDGERALAMAPARDYKRIFDGDLGPNTGGMGSYSPVAGLGAPAIAELIATVHQPVVDEMRERGTPFHGVLYGGLILTADGPRVIEFNARFGDPETQALLPRLRSDLLDALLRAARPGGLRDYQLDWSEQWAVTLVLASARYPQSPRLGDAITGLERVGPGIEVTHAGTARRGREIVTSGGRVLGVTALGDDPAGARTAAYAAAQMIEFDGKQLRSDIAAQAGADA